MAEEEETLKEREDFQTTWNKAMGWVGEDSLYRGDFYNEPDGGWFYGLKMVRAKYNISQSDLERKLQAAGESTNQGTISKWEAGKTNPRRETIYKIADVFELPLKKFMEEVRDGCEALNEMHGIDHYKSRGRAATVTSTGITLGKGAKEQKLEFATANKIKFYTTHYNVAWAPHNDCVVDDKSGIEMIECPPILKGVEEAYALKIPAPSMSPRYSIGDTLLINPKIQPMIDDDVVVQYQYGDRNVMFVRQCIGLKRFKFDKAKLNEWGTPAQELENDFYDKWQISVRYMSLISMSMLKGEQLRRAYDMHDTAAIYENDDEDGGDIISVPEEPIGELRLRKDFEEEQPLRVEVHVVVGSYRSRAKNWQ